MLSAHIKKIYFAFHKENPTNATMCQNFIILYLYKVQHVSGDTPPIIRSLKLHWQPLVFHTWKVVGRVAVDGPPLPMMGGVSPETC